MEYWMYGIDPKRKKGSAQQLKVKIRNLARKKDTSAQVVLQNFMFERFLE